MRIYKDVQRMWSRLFRAGYRTNMSEENEIGEKAEIMLSKTGWAILFSVCGTTETVSFSDAVKGKK